MTGVCPFGAQVRTNVGRFDKPDSSMKTISRLWATHFFKRWPSLALPCPYGRFGALDCVMIRPLRGDVWRAQNAPTYASLYMTLKQRSIRKRSLGDYSGAQRNHRAAPSTCIPSAAPPQSASPLPQATFPPARGDRRILASLPNRVEIE